MNENHIINMLYYVSINFKEIQIYFTFQKKKYTFLSSNYDLTVLILTIYFFFSSCQAVLLHEFFVYN